MFLIVYNTLEMSHIPILIIHSIPNFANCMQGKMGTIDLVPTCREYNSTIISYVQVVLQVGLAGLEIMTCFRDTNEVWALIFRYVVLQGHY